ncbi:MAG: FAD-binding oxidoreductase [Pseudomonadota bacterium]
MNANPNDIPNVLSQIARIVGPDNVTDDEVQRKFFSTDLGYVPGQIAALVAAPANAVELAAVVKVVSQAGMAVVPRGGGMSYTRGYQPERGDSLLVDMRRMDQIIEINEEDMYVTVASGCTWKALYEALMDKNLRTPYFGPLSGMYATVGGAISQNSLFLGSGTYNTVAESVIGLKVILADGSVVQTGSAAHKNGQPFFRHFGPDMTGVFTADTGAFGIKAEATLRLIEAPQVTLFMSFGFETIEEMIAAQAALARKRICAECYGFDPYYNKGFENQGFTFKEGLAVLRDVAGSEGGIKGLWSSFKVASSGKTFLRDVNYSLHMTFDSYDKDVAFRGLELARGICGEHGGVEIDNTLPTVFRAHPFGGVRTVLLGADGEAWLPIHGFMPLSKAVEVGSATEAFFAEHREEMEAFGIKSSYLTAFSGTEFLIEPSIYWHDEIDEFRLSLIEEEFAQKWREIPADQKRRKVALALRDGLRDLYDQHGCCHLQLGKYYPYQELIADPGLKKLLEGIKSTIDPDSQMNPGSLGLR